MYWRRNKLNSMKESNEKKGAKKEKTVAESGNLKADELRSRMKWTSSGKDRLPSGKPELRPLCGI